MKKLFSWFFPPEFFTNPAFFRAFAVGILYLGLFIAQLFTYEKFADITKGYSLPGGDVVGVVLALIIPAVELLALPALLSMNIGRVFWRISLACVVATPSLWLMISLWLNLSDSSLWRNTGLFGATVATPTGWWLTVFAALMLWAAILVVREMPHLKTR